MGSLLGLPLDVVGFEMDANESAPLTALCTAVADSVADRLNPLSSRLLEDEGCERFNPKT